MAKRRLSYFERTIRRKAALASSPETVLREAAHTVETLIQRLNGLPRKFRTQIGRPGQRVLRKWHRHMLALYNELRDAREAAEAERILHVPPELAIPPQVRRAEPADENSRLT